ncbi:hypothetical protein ACOMHN_051517 [Nucella lapillus]
MLAWSAHQTSLTEGQDTGRKEWGTAHTLYMPLDEQRKWILLDIRDSMVPL